MKKLDNIKKDHEKRIAALQSEQDMDRVRAQLIETNLPLVERAILVVNSALANQVAWEEIEEIVKDAQLQLDPVACAVRFAMPRCWPPPTPWSSTATAARSASARAPSPSG